MNSKIANSTRANPYLKSTRPFSAKVLDGPERAPSRAMLYPVGFRLEDFAKPIIGVASAWSMVTPCHMHLDQLARDVALITDGRFSGGSHGFVVGHITPEAYVGGPIALVKDGDSITIDAENRQINLELTARELRQRRQAWKARRPRYTRGCWRSMPARLLPPQWVRSPI